MNPNVSPIQHFLGCAPNAGPETLLALPRETRDESLVLTALRARLAAVAAHPDSDLPEADVARDALHAAAQSLLTPVAVAAPSPAIAPPAPPEQDQLLSEVRAILAANGGINAQSFARLTLLANSRGTTPQALIAMAARPETNGAPPPLPPSPSLAPRPAPVAAPIRRPPPPAPAMQAPVAPPPDAFDAPAPAEIDPAPRIIKMFLVGAVGLVATIGIGAIVLTWALKPSTPPAAPPVAQPTTSTPSGRGPVLSEGTSAEPKPDTQRAAVPAATDAKPTPPEAAPAHTPRDGRVREWTDVTRSLDACVTNARTDPQTATTAFEETVAEMSRRWTETTPDGVLAASNAVVDFLYAVSSDSALSSRAADAILRASADWPTSRFPSEDETKAALWSAAMVVRASRERDLPAATQRRLQEAAGAALGGRLVPKDQTFTEGLAAALVTMPSLLVAQGASSTDVVAMNKAWEAWRAALEASFGRDTPSYDRAVSLAIESVLTHAPEPTQHRPTYDLVGMLTASTSWRKDSPARASLLRWFLNESITTGDLQAVTAALATRSGAEGVDPTMVLSVTANPAARTELRDRYAGAWGILSPGHGRQSELARWAGLARGRLAVEPPKSIPEAMLHAVILARLNRAAAELSSGVVTKLPEDADTVDPAIVQKVMIAVDDPATARIFVVEYGNSQPWALQYLIEEKSGNLAAKQKLLTEFNGVIDAIAADVIAEAAFRGSPDGVRKAAQAIVKNNTAHAILVNAVLRMQPRISATLENSQLIEQVTLHALPSPRDPSWKFEARKALVARVLQLVAGESKLAVVDALSKLLAEAYARDPIPTQAAPSEISEPSTQAAKEEPASDFSEPLGMARALRVSLELDADRVVPTGREPLSLAQMTTRRRQRAALANGVVQQFNVEQLACTELLAYITVAEDPSRATQVAEVLDELASARQNVSNIVEQIAATERAALRMWVIRVGVEIADDGVREVTTPP